MGPASAIQTGGGGGWGSLTMAFVEIREGLHRVDEEVGGVRLGGVRRGGLLVGAVGDEEEEVEVGRGSGGVGGYGQAKSIEFKFQNKTTFSVATISHGG